MAKINPSADANAIQGNGTTGAKTVSLTFSTSDELEAYAGFADAAKADDRSINSFLVRVLIGKEDNPLLTSAPNPPASAA